MTGNAIKFTNTGSVDFSVRRRGDYMDFGVKDTGIGISEGKRQIIFSRFSQADNSSTRQYEGSGLGLTIAKAYAEMRDGKLWSDSIEGIGQLYKLFISPKIILTKYL